MRDCLEKFSQVAENNPVPVRKMHPATLKEGAHGAPLDCLNLNY